MSLPLAACTETTIEAVLLDAGGVLILPEHATMRAVLAPYGVDPTDAELTRAHYAGMAAQDGDLEQGWSAYSRAYVAAVGVAADRRDAAAQALFTARREWISPAPAAATELGRLATLGVPLVVVSNAVGTVEWQLGVAGVCQVGDGPGVPVEAVIDSHLVGVRKPDPAIFRLGLDAAGCAAEHALMVGDFAYADVHGAERAGIRAAHLDPYGDCRSRHAGPDVSGLAAVVELVRASRS